MAVTHGILLPVKLVQMRYNKVAVGPCIIAAWWYIVDAAILVLIAAGNCRSKEMFVAVNYWTMMFSAYLFTQVTEGLG